MLAFLFLLPGSGPIPSSFAVMRTVDVTAFDAPKLQEYIGRHVRMTRIIEGIEYDGDQTRITYQETDELPEVDASFTWWRLPYEFDEDVLTKPWQSFRVTVSGTLTVKDGRWIIHDPVFHSWN